MTKWNAFPGKSAVLNDAFKYAKGDAVLVFDADARIEPDFLNKLVPNLEPEDVGAVQARKIISNRDVNFLTRCQELRGNGELIKRKALEDIGGWNNYTLVDDLDMSTRLHIKGWDIRFCPEAEVREEAVIYLMPLYRQRRRWYEGTVRRYLELFGDVITSKKMSLRARLDMTAYLSEFLMPTWFIFEVIIRCFKVLTGKVSVDDIGIITSLLVGLVIGICFTLATRYSLRKYNNLGRWEALKQAVETSAYILAVWFPVAFYISFKILLKPKDMDWGKTTHGLVLEEEQHRQDNKEKETVGV